ncbi:MAG: hypothetical protein R6V06_04510 [Kiritimatiellia bacterium]
MVNTNAVQEWQARANKQGGDDFLALKGVVADKKKMEIRILAEAVGHAEGVVTEFILIGPRSDRAYEAFAVAMADPGDIVRTVEFMGFKRGSCVDGNQFCFVPFGQRFRFFVRRPDVENSKEMPVTVLLKESQPDDPMLADDAFIFAGGNWETEDGKPVCKTSTVPPCSVISLYNESSVFDIFRQADQNAVYGRFAVKEEFPYGVLLEFVARPVSNQPTALPVAMNVVPENDGFAFQTQCDHLKVDKQQSARDTVQWLRSLSDEGKDIFATVRFDENLTASRAADAAALFEIISERGVRLYGKGENSVYYKAFLPQESWREREGRNPQPFEVHVTRDNDGKLKKKLVFVEEDWDVPGIDPELNPQDYPFDAWSDLKPLVEKVGGKDNKVNVLFFFVPGDLKLSEFMPGINSLSERLPLVHIFTENQSCSAERNRSQTEIE